MTFNSQNAEKQISGMPVKMNIIRIRSIIATFSVICVIIYMAYSDAGRNYRHLHSFERDTQSLLKCVRPENNGIGDGRPYLIPSDEVLGKLNDEDLLKMYWRYVNTLQILCQNQSRLGSLGDGGKEVCLDGIFEPKRPCIVYSFGSNFQFDFEVAVYKIYGCDVYTFDPSMEVEGTDGKERIPKDLTFKKVGLSGKDYVTSKSWQMKTLQAILKENGQENAIVDILKIDIDGDEWAAIPNILESGVHRQVKQLLVEFHFGYNRMSSDKVFWGNRSMTQQIRVFRMLYEFGFRVFMRERVKGGHVKLWEPNYHKIATQNELSLVNTAFLQH